MNAPTVPNDVKPPLRIELLEPSDRAHRSWIPCRVGSNIEFSTERLETYCLAEWDPIVYDALLVAAAVEFADRIQHRPAGKWDRHFELRIPVHDEQRWNATKVSVALREAVGFLTGDDWNISFVQRQRQATPPGQKRFVIPDAEAVIPFSDGLDSRIVAALAQKTMGDSLIRVRLGSRTRNGLDHPFTSVPYRVKPNEYSFPESSARSRGFKFALISGLAAYLSGARNIIVPESGQGALGPALVTVGQSYEDYRSHPLFARKMENFLSALLGIKVRFVFPVIWNTKGETLAQYIAEVSEQASWADTWSCWQQSRQVSVSGSKRQCGICAACMLRRMSVHAAGLRDIPEKYVWEDLTATCLELGAASGFPREKITKKLREYAIAGTLHLDHLAGVLDSPANNATVDLTCYQLSRAMGLPQTEIRQKLIRMLKRHSSEWSAFVNALGESSFIALWAVNGGV